MRPFVLVIGLVMHHGDGLLLVGDQIAVCLLHQLEGGHLGVDQGIRVVLGLVELGQLLGKAGVLHQVDEATAHLAVGPRVLAVGGDEVPIDAVVALRPVLLPVANGQDPHVLLFVGRILVIT